MLCNKKLCLLVIVGYALMEATNGTLMLGSMMLAAKTGLMLGKLGVGGMMMMLLAATQNGLNEGGGSDNLYRRKRLVRSTSEEEKLRSDFKDGSFQLSDRMIRQIDSTFDTFTCIPKFICGINAQKPTKKTSFLNDYSHLLKLLFTRDDADDESDEVNDKPKRKNTNKRKKNKNSGPNKQSKHDFEDKDIEDLVNDELLDDDPELLPFILKDVVNRKPYGGGGLDDPELTFLQAMANQAKVPPRNDPFSGFTSFLPTVEAGLGTKVRDSDFDSDPFFDGFRSLKDIFLSNENATLNGNDTEELHVHLLDVEPITEETVLKPKEKSEYIRRMSRQVQLSTDAVKRYQIAANVGKKLKNKNDCRRVFKKCPYSWNEVTGMVSNLRNTIANHPMITGKPLPAQDKVVYLKTTTGSNGDKSVMSIATAGQDDEGGTKVLHDLGNGNLMEISMKLLPMLQLPSSATVRKPVSAVETLGPNLAFNKQNDQETENKPGSAKPSVLSTKEEEINQAVANLQLANLNEAFLKNKRRKHYIPSNIGKLPILKEELATLPPIVTEDDELEDAYPILIKKAEENKKLIKNEVPKKDEVEFEDEVEEGDGEDDEANGDDEEGDGDNDEEEEDGDDYYDEYVELRKLDPPVRPKVIFSRRQAPIVVHKYNPSQFYPF